MAAGVHRARNRRGVRLRRRLDDRQRVHVGTQRDDRPVAEAAADHPDDAALAEATMDFVDAEFLQFARDEFRCPVNLEADLGMLMDVPAPADDFIVHLVRAVQDRHRGLRFAQRRLASGYRHGNRKCCPTRRP